MCSIIVVKRTCSQPQEIDAWLIPARDQTVASMSQTTPPEKSQHDEKKKDQLKNLTAGDVSQTKV